MPAVHSIFGKPVLEAPLAGSVCSGAVLEGSSAE